MIDLSGVGVDYQAVLPLLVVTAVAILVLFLDLFLPSSQRRLVPLATIAGLVVTLATTVPLWGQHRLAFGDTVAGDTYSAFFNVLLVGVAIVTVAISPRYLAAQQLEHSEYYILVLAATGGMMLLAAATSLMTVFLGIELLSLALYVLSGFARAQLRSQESAMKYLLLGGFATGFLLYGMALIYAATGSTALKGIAAYTAANPGTNSLLLLGIGLLSVGLAFKASAAPFHMWTPDVYEGAPTIVTTFMSVATKAAAFAAVGRIFVGTFPTIQSQWVIPLAGIAVASMAIGNVVAITQRNLKRMLAYSGIAHAGFIVLGILPGTAQGLSATLFYIAAYAAMNFGAFAVVTSLGTRGEETANLGYWTGLFYRNRYLATMMAIFMLSLAGIPITVGFWAKLFVFQALVAKQLWFPLAIAIITTVVSFYYYLRVIVVMFTVPEGAAVEPEQVNPSMASVIGLAGAATLLVGVFPNLVLDLAREAIKPLLG